MNPSETVSEIGLNKTPCWLVLILCALAGGMGWGIRGQYGHESGAMIAGLLVGAVICMCFCGNAGGLATARALAWCTIGIGIGGSMTYGQTVGLTQNANLIGDWESWRWGMLGLGIKGGIWIGFAGAFLGMGLSGTRYARCEMLALMLALPLLYLAGVWILNSPFDPKHGLLPKIYFSIPGEKPRFECWGGLLFSLAGLIAFTSFRKGDPLAWRLALAGLAGGALGFPGGQCWQSWHAWNRESFQTGAWASWDPFINWWNLMETTFGMVMGSALGLGVWLNRHWVKPTLPPDARFSSVFLEISLLVIHLVLLATSEFLSVPVINSVYGLGLGMAVIPMVACTASRWWPYWLAGPVLLMPIAGKTVRRLVYNEGNSNSCGWLWYFVLPMLFSVIFAWWMKKSTDQGMNGAQVGRFALLWGSLMYFLLNFAFFGYPFPWEPWTGRTPSALVFAGCMLILLGVATFAFKKQDSGISQGH